MITVTDLRDRTIYLNADLIETVQSNPDTQIVLTTGRHLYVKESPAEILQRIVYFRQTIGCALARVRTEPSCCIMPEEPGQER